MGFQSKLTGCSARSLAGKAAEVLPAAVTRRRPDTLLGLVLLAAVVAWPSAGWAQLAATDVTVTTPFPQVGEPFITSVDVTITSSQWQSTEFTFDGGTTLLCAAVPTPARTASGSAFVPVQSTQNPGTGTYTLEMFPCASPDCATGTCGTSASRSVTIFNTGAGGEPGLGSAAAIVADASPSCLQTIADGFPRPDQGAVPSVTPGNFYDTQIRYGRASTFCGPSQTAPTTCGDPPPTDSSDPCYIDTYVDEQSGLGYEGYNAVPFRCDQDVAIPTGIFTHFNNPIFASEFLISGSLDITLFDNNQPTTNSPCTLCGKSIDLVGLRGTPPTPTTPTFDYSFEETPNNGNCPYGATPPGSNQCNDRVEILNAAASAEPVIGDDGNVCEVVLLGFAPCQDPTQASNLDLSAEYITAERQQNDTCLWVAPGVPVPVTLSSVRARVAKKKTFTVDWTTASETDTVGFIVWARVGGLWYQLNDDLIPTQAFNSASAQEYAQEYAVDRLPGRVQAYGLTTVEVDGREYFYGPFRLGRRYGDGSAPPPIPWAAVREDLKERMALAGLRWDGERWVAEDGADLTTALWASRGLASPMSAAAAAGGPPSYDLRVKEPGMVRVGARELTAAGLDLTGVPLDDIAILDSHGKPVPRFIAGRRGRFGPRSYIDFFATPLSPEDALYTDENLYRVVVDSDLAVSPVTVRTRPRDVRRGDAVTSALDLTRVDDNRQYSIGMPTGSPWYDQHVIARPDRPQSIQRTLEVHNLVPGRGAMLQLGLGGFTDFKGADDDHHVRVFLNDELVADAREDGIVDWQLQAELPEGLLQAGSNELKIQVTGDTGYVADMVALDTFGVMYERALIGREGLLEFNGDAADSVYEVAGLGAGRRLVGYAWKDGVLYRLVGLRTVRRDGAKVGRFKGAPVDGATHWVSRPGALRKAEVTPTLETGDLLAEAADADYLILAHSAFIGEELDAYVTRRTADGYRPKVFDVNAIYAQFGGGLPVPRAIRAFLEAAAQVSDYEHVLLVGGACSDPLNYLGKDCVDFIPTMYGPTGDRTFFTPSDALLVRFDDDAAAAKAIGRWPVRTLTQLETIIKKTGDFDDNGLASQASALLIADKRDQSGLSFETQAKAVGRELVAMQADDAAWPWPLDAEDRVFLDDYDKVTDARADMISRLSEGPAMTVFSGHGAPGLWTFSGLFNYKMASQLTNAGRPSLTTALACYTTYFDDPSTQTLGHQLLFGGDYGAVAIQGATTLADFVQNGEMAERTIAAMLREGATLGRAIQQSRETMLEQGRGAVAIAWQLNGDPTLQLSPEGVPAPPQPVEYDGLR